MRPRLTVLRVLILWTGWFAGVGVSAQNTLFLPCDATALTGEQKASRPERLAYRTDLRNTVRSEITFACAQPADITHPFSVSPDRQVLFSPGNLQYNAALGTHRCADGSVKPGTWRFAEHQWDYVGDTKNGTVYYNGTKCDNTQVSESYDGWIDLFGWGTSGWESGAAAYQPWAVSTTGTDYQPGGDPGNHLTEDYAYADWAVYNQIGDDPAGTWRTLTTAEWTYVFEQRPGYAFLRGQATVCGIHGYMLLPDDWVAPAGISFTNGTGIGYDVNVYSPEQWAAMEAEGAVFLSASGSRKGTEFGDNAAGNRGAYWSVSGSGNTNAYRLWFRDEGAEVIAADRNYGRPVRPVKDLTPVSPLTDYQPMPFSVAADRQVCFSPGNLQYNATRGSHRCSDGSVQPGTWRFAERQWDYVGDAQNGTVYHNGTKCSNTDIGETYNGWIDLFGWGTSGWNSGANAWQPWAASVSNSNYYPGGSETNDLTGDYAYSDWARYNTIGYHPAGTWRTLAKDEWVWLFHERENAERLFGMGTVNGVQGTIILPDGWVAPAGITFNASTDKGLEWNGTYYESSTKDVYSHNVYTDLQWGKMEAAGAVFLPAGGGRSGTTVNYASESGNYWSSSRHSAESAFRMRFYTHYLDPSYDSGQNLGRSVRPVRDVEPPPPPSAYEPKPFSVAADRQVLFSPGNLQYNAALGTHPCADGTTQKGTWRFAEHQYDYVGDTEKGNVYENGVKCRNSRVSNTYDGWIDLFGWGTSGWNSGSNAYQPWETSQTSRDYMPGGNAKNNLTGVYAYSDWGVYNAVGDDPAGTWRTLTKEEWTYLFRERKNADKLFGLGTVNGVKGTVILPDGWVTPPGVTFNASTDKGLSWQETNYANSAEDNYSHNTYTARQWEEQMAANGAVFLPSAGYRYGTTMTKTGEYGSYWSASACETEYISDFNFSESRLCPQYDARRFGGRSVRPVKDVTPPPSAYEPKPFSISAGRQALFSPGNLQYNAALGTHQCADGTTQPGTWRFAEHQWDYAGDTEKGTVWHNGIKCDNTQASESYNGWIDLFGWGTSGWESGAKAYQPWATSQTNQDYYPGGNENNNLSGDYANADWGVYNQIADDAPGTWRVLSNEEWRYVFHERENAESLFGLGTVNGVPGTIILPDGWVTPPCVTFNASTGKGLSWQGSSYDDSGSDHFSDNTYTSLQWEEQMAANGAVFLPAAGNRIGTSASAIGTSGRYWSSTQHDPEGAFYLIFNSDHLHPHGDYYRNYGRSVRPVKDITPPPSAYEPKPFSVSPDRQITFSPGNLQFNAAQGSHLCADGSTKQGTWRFAVYQWDCVGDEEYGTVRHNGAKCSNTDIGESYKGWIDLFGWGTSGWESGAQACQPWEASTTDEDYRPGGSEENDLTGSYSYSDWAVYNPIGDDPAGTWRTLTNDEWVWLFQKRADAERLFGLGTVNGVHGTIVLPDGWTAPDGTVFTANTTDYSGNVYSEKQWAVMESAGAVFLPVTGNRRGTEIVNVSERGDVWSSTHSSPDGAYSFCFSTEYFLPQSDSHRRNGRSVRPVKDVTPLPSAYEPKPFSVSPDRQITFSPGNLQFNAALGTHQCADGTTQQGIWRFAEHQWDYVGDTENGTVYHNGVKCDNTHISDTYDGWIDFFGWGTSGWDSGAKEYQPWATGKANDDYISEGYEESDLTGSLALADWGMYNEINGDTPGTWRSLTKEESYYLLVGRAHADRLFGFGTVNGITGLILLPDEWTTPAEVTFASGGEKGMEWDSNSGLYNSDNGHFADNVYTDAQWRKMENAGAVFLPASGYRREKTGYSVGESGHYWLVSYGIHESAHGACYIKFPSNRLYPERHHYRYNGGSLRLVKDIATPPPPSAYEPKPFSVSADRKILFSPGNLQYNAALSTHQCADGTTLQGTWRFAEHQYDYVGNAEYGTVYMNGVKCDNELVSESYDGWIDLFGWGTTGWDNGAKAYQPWATSQEDDDYVFADWGAYNQIGNDPAGTWRVLTGEEWKYILEERPGYADLRGQAAIDGIEGYMLLPDDWEAPEGITFTGGMDIGYNVNVYTLRQWSAMEAAGAVFLPAACSRVGTEWVSAVRNRGAYWSSSACDSKQVIRMYFRSDVAEPACHNRFRGRTARLVKDIHAAPPPSAYEPKPFSVSADRQITFSPGNLQYNAAQGTHLCADGTTLQGTWRFAEHQWDIAGMGYGQTDKNNHCYIGGTVQNGDNWSISETYDGWIDLFGWGTSGWNSGAITYHPWSTSTNNSDYYPGGSYENNLTGDCANADWGVYNRIGDDGPGTWRTLTYDEWNYLINTRTNAGSKYGVASVNGMTGVVILPDDFTLPADCGFTPGMTNASDWYDWSDVATTNIYTSAQWQLMEAAGAVFLPCAGDRNRALVFGAGAAGRYWSSSANNSDNAYYLSFSSDGLHTYANYRYRGFSVRLAKDQTPPPPPSAYEPKPFSVSSNRQITFSPGNLQYNATQGSHQCADGTTLQGTWRFAEHQWDYVGDDNKNISATYDGWIDLFGWGTSGWNSGANTYQPWAMSVTNSDYYPGNSYENNLTGNYANADWGVYNQIGDDEPGSWRTLTKDEWNYLISTRPDAINKYGAAKVNGMTGVVILPDVFTLPADCGFTAGMTSASNWYDWSYVATTNIYTATQWQLMEAAGAVFLPCAGGRDGTAMCCAGTDSRYWTSTIYDSDYAYGLYFASAGLGQTNLYRHFGRSVRPVKDVAPPPPPSAYNPKPFSIAPNRQITFSSGNLQYNAAQGTHQCADGTTQQGTWRFAEHQWDYVGDTENGNVYQNGIKCNNALISDTYDGWIDLFSWGTSGWSGGVKAYQPWATSKKQEDYVPGGDINNNLTGDYAYADWTIYNQIGNDAPSTWRTLTEEEWRYLFEERPGYAERRGHATVNGVQGYILLPDDWTMPDGMVFKSGTNDNFQSNVYEQEQWQAMESAGAVFLPAAGSRDGEVLNPNSIGNRVAYWAVTACDANNAYRFSIVSGLAEVACNSRYLGRPVRPVKDIAPLIPPSAYEPKPFSVAADRQITFSSGNLQYNAAQGSHQCADGTTQQGTWRFAEHQWDYVGDSENGNVYQNSIKCDNAHISDTYDGWIDLFCWGTSGWDSGAKAYLPWATNSDNTDYTPGGSETNNLTGDYANADWGIYNRIGDDAPGTWRTLTGDEWNYLISARPDAANKCGASKVNGMTGLVILPDDFTLPTGCGFTPGKTTASDWDDWTCVATTNIYSAEQWQLMEQNGAVFLPCAGYRKGTKLSRTGMSGYCWSSTAYDANNAYRLDFSPVNLNAGFNSRCFARSVRLVKDQTPPPSAYNPQPFSIAPDRQITFSPGNLQYNAAQGSHQCADGTTHQGTWRFAEHQWDYVGNTKIGTVYHNGTKCSNTKISSKYDGWIDLFAWGTSGWNSGAKYYQPWHTNKDNINYRIGGQVENDLRGEYSYADWGIFNDIMNGTETDRAGTWRTMTEDEWGYIVLHRPNAADLFALATVNGVKGMILLPDNWNPADKLHIVTSTEQGFYVTNDTIYNDNTDTYDTNILSATQWLIFEAAGAVFLPSAGHRHEKTVHNLQKWGDYSPSTNMAHRYRKDKYELPIFFFSDITCKAGCPTATRYCGKSIRLVSDCPPSSAVPPRSTTTVAADYWTPYTEYWPEEPDPWISTGHRTATAELWTAEPERKAPKPERKTPKEDDPEDDTYVEEPADTLCWQPSYRFHDYDYPLPDLTACRDRDYVAYTLEYFDKDACMHYLKDIVIATQEGGTVELYDTICDGSAYDFFGDQLTKTDVYTHTVPIARDCEQVYILHLTVHPSYSGIEQTEHICPSGSFVWNGAEYTDEGDYTLSLSSANGCDSLVTLHLRHYPYYERQLTDTLLTGQTILFEGTELAEAGTYSVTLPTVDGCDSVITLLLEENAVQVLSAACNDLCSDKEELHISLDFTGTAHSVRLTFDSAAHVAGWRDTLIVLTDDGDIVLPARGRVGQFTCTAELLFRDTTAASVTIPFTLPYPSTVLKQLWDDGVAVMNADYNGGYDFVAFQWYENGVPLAGETASILYRPLIMGGEYSALLTESNGRQMLCCPLIATSRTALETPQTTIHLHPTVANPLQSIHCQSDQPASLTVYDVQGRQTEQLILPAGHSTFPAPAEAGLYLLLLHSLPSGKATTAKLIVVPN